jgi:hypothetical protein
MLDLAISEDIDRKGRTVILTNHGERLRARRWPQYSDFQLVAFPPSAKACQVFSAEELAADIAAALKVLHAAGTLASPKPDWYRRLARCASGAD